MRVGSKKLKNLKGLKLEMGKRQEKSRKQGDNQSGQGLRRRLYCQDKRKAEEH